MMAVVKTAKRIVKAIIYRPHGVDMGIGSYVMRPRWLHNRERIHIGKRCWIGRFAIFNPLVQQYEGLPQQGAIRLGDDVYIGGFSQIHSMFPLQIGDGCVLSEHVYISDISHGLDPRRGLIMQQPLESKGPVCIGKSVLIGFGASVLPGVTLGDHCVVGTGSVVTHSFPAYSMITGAPARLVKVFDQDAGKWLPAVKN